MVFLVSIFSVMLNSAFNISYSDHSEKSPSGDNVLISPFFYTDSFDVNKCREENSENEVKCFCLVF